jgi:hypothetical protein
MPQPLEFEGTWEEIAAHAPELAGRRVRLTVLAPANEGTTLPHQADKTEASISFWKTSTREEIFACQGIQPVRDLASFLESLPDFGQDGIRLWEAIAEDRTLRRALAGETDC